ncbi:DUF4199 domain-containing protein [Pontibacter sp. JH31]|uniref:DUF4199 domain-containing protein n=1 Tax=Pontibacter aquaedesilientis TaxID=2766980 RepID=A0ABR7XKH6_9BACT|nr:DUF4199 domain-containing protein [Pontibacter aquaedesilientis]MBD1398784.1 DUF4199 domain-containing protein [Pontibacter aquaedesilientis]
MLNQTIVRVGVRYGVLCGLACFVIVLALYLLGYNPLGESGRWSYLPLPVFIFMGLRYFKGFHDAEVGFWKGMRVSLAVTFYTALCASMLIYLMIYLVGPELIQQHVAELRAVLDQTRNEQIKLLGEQNFEKAYEDLDTISPSMLAAYDFLSRMFVGGVFSVVASVFFRK